MISLMSHGWASAAHPCRPNTRPCRHRIHPRQELPISCVGVAEGAGNGYPRHLQLLRAVAGFSTSVRLVGFVLRKARDWATGQRERVRLNGARSRRDSKRVNTERRLGIASGMEGQPVRASGCQLAGWGLWGWSLRPGAFPCLFCCLALHQVDVLQLSGRLAGDVKESPNGNPTRDLQMAADRIRPHTLCGPVVSSLLSFTARC